MKKLEFVDEKISSSLKDDKRKKSSVIPAVSRKVIPLSDLHVGSRVGLAPIKYRTKSGHFMFQSEWQRKMHFNWNRFVEFADPFPGDLVILCGDICDGNNFKENGRQTTTSELEEQMEQALMLLEPFKRCKIVGVSGSAYHRGREVDLDRLIIERMGGEWFGVLGFVEVEPTEQTILFRHGAGCPINRARKQEKESREIDEAIGRGKIEKGVDVIIRGHEHEWRCLDVEHRLNIVLPGWKGMFPYKNAEGHGRYMGRPGSCVIYMQKGEQPEVRKKLFDYIPCYDALKKV